MILPWFCWEFWFFTKNCLCMIFQIWPYSITKALPGRPHRENCQSLYSRLVAQKLHYKGSYPTILIHICIPRLGICIQKSLYLGSCCQGPFQVPLLRSPYEGIDEDCGDSWRHFLLLWLRAFLFSALLLPFYSSNTESIKLQDTIVWHALKNERAPHICTGSTPCTILVCRPTLYQSFHGRKWTGNGESALS